MPTTPPFIKLSGAAAKQ